MNQDYVTRLVVGPSISVALGQPAVTTARRREGLRLDGADWVPAASKQLAADGTQPTGHARRWRSVLSGHAAQYGAAGVTLVLISATCAALFWPAMPATKPKADTLPIAPAPQLAGPTAAVTMVPAPYEPALPLPTAGSPAGQDGPSGPMPSEAGAIADEAAQAAKPAPVHLEARAPTPTAAAPVVPAPVRAQASQPVEAARAKPLPPAAPARSDKDKTEKAEKANEDKAVKAVIMDDAPAPKANPTTAPKAPAAAAQTSAKPAAPAVVPVATPTAAKPAQARGIGLLAIAPDGKSAAFTNPKTRLPEQFKIGDQLPNGETVRSIDLKEGRVVTNTKEYGLE